MKIEDYYKIHFWRVIIVPFIIILLVVMLWVSYINKSERSNGLRICSENVRDILIEEISDCSTRFSYFMTSNDNEVLNNITVHNRGSIEEKYLSNNELIHWYNLNVMQISPFVTIDFYLKDNNMYSFEKNTVLERRKIINSDWYQDTIKNPDKIRINVVKAETTINSKGNMPEEELIIASMRMKNFDKSTDVDMGVLTAKSKALEMISNPGNSWDEKYFLYLVNDEGKILSSTYHTDETDIAEEIKHLEEQGDIDYHTVIEPRTKFRIISAVDKNEYGKKYRILIYIIIIGMLVVFFILYFSVKRLFLHVIRPVNELSQTMNKVKQKGEFNKVKVEGFEEIKIIKDTYNGMLDKVNYLIKENENKEKDKNKEEMKALERQLNPHFLSNTIGNIRFIAMISRFESIQKMTEALMIILDSSFRNNRSFHTLDEELNILSSYIYLMQIRYANNFQVEYEIDDDIKDIEVPKLILQPFVENSITHGFVDRDIFGEIKIKIRKEMNHINVEITDNGAGIPNYVIEEITNGVSEEGKHIGINNISKRLKLYYGEEYDIKIESKEKVLTTISFKIPC